MSPLSFIEKETVRRLFGIADGFVFNYWSQKGMYNKNKTRDLILDSCGINIYEHKDFTSLSQQKCIEKIFNEYPPQIIAKLLRALTAYYDFGMGTDYRTCEEQSDYNGIQDIITRLESDTSVSLPEHNTTDLNLILSDIQSNISDGKPELVVDRLHTFASQFIRATPHK